MPALKGAGMRGNQLSGAGWCPGCGLHHAATGEHRADCTARCLGCGSADTTATRTPAGTMHECQACAA